MVRHREVMRVIVMGVLLAVATATAVAAAVEFRSNRDVTLSGPLDELALLAGGRVEIGAETSDDVVAAGGDVLAQNASADHLILAGGKVTLADVDVQDVYIAAGDVSLLSGRITDDVVAAGGQVALRENLIVDGAVVVHGGEVIVEASVGSDLNIAGAKVRLNGPVGGDVQITGRDVTIGPNARIVGDLRYHARAIDIAAEAVVEGETIVLEEPPEDEVGATATRFIIAAAVFGILFTLGLAVLVLVSIVALPGLMQNAATMIRSKPLATLGIGFLITAAAPVVLGLLFVSVIGMPLALLIGAMYLAAAPLAIAASTYVAGLWARGRINKGAGALSAGAGLGWTLLSIVALVVVGFIPLIGGLAWFVAYVFGVGAIITQAGRALSQGAPEPTVT